MDVNVMIAIDVISHYWYADIIRCVGVRVCVRACVRANVYVCEGVCLYIFSFCSCSLGMRGEVSSRCLGNNSVGRCWV